METEEKLKTSRVLNRVHYDLYKRLGVHFSHLVFSFVYGYSGIWSGFPIDSNKMIVIKLNKWKPRLAK